MVSRYLVCCCLGVLGSLIACTTGYQAHGFTGGYSEQKISDSAYVVTFNGNGNTSKDRIYYFWMYRCAELTLQNGYALFLIRTNPRSSAQMPKNFSMRPAVYNPDNSGAFVKVSGGGGVIIVPGTSSTAWTNSGTVLMFKKPLPPELVWAIDAQEVVNALKAYVVSNGAAPVPTRSELFLSAFVAHSHVSFATDIPVSMIDPSGQQLPDGRPLRPAQKVVDGLREAQFVALHTLYRRYLLSAGVPPNTLGSVTLAFTISSNGQVIDCSVKSSTFANPQFAQAVANLITQTEFGPQSVAVTTFSNFRILFDPI